MTTPSTNLFIDRNNSFDSREITVTVVVALIVLLMKCISIQELCHHFIHHTRVRTRRMIGRQITYAPIPPFITLATHFRSNSIVIKVVVAFAQNQHRNIIITYVIIGMHKNTQRSPFIYNIGNNSNLSFIHHHHQHHHQHQHDCPFR